MTSFHAPRWLLVLPTALLCACGSGPKSNASKQVLHVSGKVVSESQTALAGVTVALPSLKATATTDASGAFDVAATGASVGDVVPVLVTHPSYSRLASTLQLRDATTSKNYSLRPHDVVMSVALPASATDADAVVNVERADAGASLNIGFAALAMPDGTAAAGAANVKLTYWHPNQDFVTSPAPLQGTVAGDAAVKGLFSYGMVNIEISQGDTLLKVAEGKTLGLAFRQPPGLQTELAGLDPTAHNAPMLWYADETTGMWASAGTLGSGALAVDPNTKTINAKLPHLSAWNIDGITTPNLCVTGKVTDKCGKVQANTDLTLWVHAGGELAQFDVHTGADGSYCSNLIGSAQQNEQKQSAEFFAWITARKLPVQTACNPTDKDSFAALCGNNPGPYCAGVDINNAAASNTYAAVDYSAKAQACGIAKVSAPLCGYCPGTANVAAGACQISTERGFLSVGKMVEGACTAMPAITVPWCGTPPTNNDPCTAGGARKKGDPCQQDADCCPNNELQCSDFVCVPLKD